MRNVAKAVSTTAAGAVLGGSLALTAGLGIAGAQTEPVTTQDGLVNVAIGDIGVLEDVNMAAAAQIAAGVCDVEVGPVNALAQAADVEGAEQAVCTNNLGAVRILQNVPAESADAPAEETPTESPTADPEEPSAEQGTGS
jgi:hypothetical protein